MSTLADLMRDHDADPEGTAIGLRTLAGDGVPAADRPRLCWLINHVIGEKLGGWAEALALIKPLCSADVPAGAWRQLGVAAWLAGDALTVWEAEARLGDAQAGVAIRLGVLERLVEAVPGPRAAAALSQCLALIDGAPPGGLTPMLAASVNNVVSALLEREGADFAEPGLRAALTAGAALCRVLWGRAGSWVNQERADYLVALVANQLGDYAAGREAARSGLALIAAHGVEEVDRAFLLLELARAERGLGFEAGFEAARDAALVIAAGFMEDWLVRWVAARSAVALGGCAIF